MGNTQEEDEWIAGSRDGDHASFETLIRMHQTMILALTFRMTGSVADSKDLAQETFLRAYRQFESYRGTAKFSSWLYRVAFNACLDWQRREKRRGQIFAHWSEDIDAASTAHAESGLDDETSRKVQAALMKLPAKQRAAIVLTVYGEHTHGEAAKILGCSETTVSWRLFAARNKLKRLLRAEGNL